MLSGVLYFKLQSSGFRDGLIIHVASSDIGTLSGWSGPNSSCINGFPFKCSYLIIPIMLSSHEQALILMRCLSSYAHQVEPERMLLAFNATQILITHTHSFSLSPPPTPLSLSPSLSIRVGIFPACQFATGIQLLIHHLSIYFCFYFPVSSLSSIIFL
jgi:hypothetical protein